MLQYSICAFLAPALVSAAAFPWALPEPTYVNAVADWSPAPTQAPGLGAMELFKRADNPDTCGYVSAKSTSSLVCLDPGFVCVTNAANGVHGCCDKSSVAQCKIATTCIASTDMSKSCTNSACSSNDFIAKCTDSDRPSCYEWRYVFSTQTVMTEHGCASEGFTISAQFTFTDGPSSSAPSRIAQSSQPTSDPSSTDGDKSKPKSDGPTSASAPASNSPTGGSVLAPVSKSKSNIGAIVGGVVGGLAILGALAFAIIFLVLRSKKAKQEAAHNAATGASQPMIGPGPGVTEYKPHDGYSPAPQHPPTPATQYAQTPVQQYAVPYAAGGAAAGYYGQDHKSVYQQQGVPGSSPGSPAPPHGVAPFAVPPGAPVEAGGTEIPRIQTKPEPAELG